MVLIDIVQLDRSRPVPLYVQIADAVEQAIHDGRYGPGERLPSSRALAQHCGTTPVTVNQAYQRLRSRGAAVSRVGSGTYVSGAVVVAPVPDASLFLRMDRREPSPALFPTMVIREIMDRILDEEGGAAFAYGDPGGDPMLKEVIRTDLIERGFAVNGQDLVVFSGAQQALSLLLRAFVQRGDWVLVERPTYPGMLRLLQQIGAQVEALDIGTEGPDPEQVARVLATRPIRLFYTMPVYHNPTGICWSEECKRQVASLCATAGVTIIEDDALSGLDFGTGAPRPMAVSAPACRNIIYIRSFSMILMPGFRLGVCLAPRDASNTLKRAKEQADLLTSEFFQRVLCRFISEGHMRRHLALIEPYYRKLFAGALSSAEELLTPAGFRLLRPAGGPSLWGRLPEGIPSALFQRECIRHGVGVVAGQEYSLDQATADSLGMAFSRLRQTEWNEGLRRIVAAAESARQNSWAGASARRGGPSQ